MHYACSKYFINSVRIMLIHFSQGWNHIDNISMMFVQYRYIIHIVWITQIHYVWLRYIICIVWIIQIHYPFCFGNMDTLSLMNGHYLLRLDEIDTLVSTFLKCRYKIRSVCLLQIHLAYLIYCAKIAQIHFHYVQIMQIH